MRWHIVFCTDLLDEVRKLDGEVQVELAAMSGLLREFGPQLGRPHVGTLNRSKHANMKELRFSAAGGVWRFAFAFDPDRHAIILCGGDKSGGSEERFYSRLIGKADKRYDAHLALADNNRKR